jgi:DNA-binding transcriptional regulator YdaS (Cro superfamily)
MQRTIEFFRDLQGCRKPLDAPPNIVRQVDSARTAMRTALRIAGMKRLVLARMFGVTESYVCQIVNQRKPMPEWWGMAFAYATGSNLLKQYLALQAALHETAERADWLERKLANEMREVA